MMTIKATAEIEFKDGRRRVRKFWTFRLPAVRFYEVIMKRVEGPDVQSVVIRDVKTWAKAKDVVLPPQITDPEHANIGA